MRPPRVAVIGAGPVGIDAALAAVARGWDVALYESGQAVGAGVRDWGHVRLFTPWSMNVSPRMRALLGERSPDGAPEAHPTGDELVEQLLEPVAATSELAGRVRVATRVVAIGRSGLVKNEEIATEARAARQFLLLVEDDAGERLERADVVIDASGALAIPNSVGDGGIPAPGERALDGAIERRIPDVAGAAADFAGKTVVVVGAGHSAQGTVSDLAGLAADGAGTRVVWAVRDADPGWDGALDDPLPLRADLVTRSRQIAAGASSAVDVRLGTTVTGLGRRDGRLVVTLGREGAAQDVIADRVLALVGATGDGRIYRQLQVHECYATAAPMSLSAALLAGESTDCLAQAPPSADTLRNPEPGFFIIGAKSHGRFGAFLVQAGYGQVDEVMGLLERSPAPVTT